LITVSIVSHRHGTMVSQLIRELLKFPSISQIILTLNTTECMAIESHDRIQIIENKKPLGFGENHNNAYSHCTQPYFCVLNPDIEFVSDPFPALLSSLLKTNASLVAPLIVSSSGEWEDSARYFPTMARIVKKIIFSDQGKWPVDLHEAAIYPDWVAGMFMLFKSDKFKEINGFDTSYFLYYEDVDICRRIRRHGDQVALCTQVKAVHNAQRTSRKSIKYLYWHIKSLTRYLLTNYK
jgi:N-acetylglucosaminyl-diphospho-decaprenol L-rhamnosyltransferase